MIVLVTGSRDWQDRKFLCDVLNLCLEVYGMDRFFLIQGMAPGADSMALTWAVIRKIDHACFYAHWDLYDKAAGPIRNAYQADLMKPNLCLAFHPDIDQAKGTKNQVDYIRKNHPGCRVVVLTGKEQIDQIDWLVSKAR